MRHLILSGYLLLLCAMGSARGVEPATVRVATYNLENYLNSAASGRPLKPAAAKARIVDSILGLKPDVLALQEIGGTNELMELQTALQRVGLSLPHWELVAGFDTNIHVAVLSRYPMLHRQAHNNGTFLLGGRRHHVLRGFAEVEIEVSSTYRFTLITAHLKSRRVAIEADESELREQEALLLRKIISARLEAKPALNLVVLGDFNDVKSSRAVRALIGRGRTRLIDTRPGEKNGDPSLAEPGGFEPRTITWTHYFGKEDSYSRIDYILVSLGMEKEWDRSQTYVSAVPGWGLASDHRPLVATFVAGDR